MHPLIKATELNASLKDVLIFDCRATLGNLDKGLEDFNAGHIPGAVHADLDSDLSCAPGDGGRHPLPQREALEAKFRAWGIDSHSHLICYDQNNGAFAARFWWLARWLGHACVQILDGGLDAWTSYDYPTEMASTERAPGNFTASEPLTRTCQLEEVLSGHHKLLDARDAARFRGEQEPIDPVAGHIPGAVCAPFSANLIDGHFRSAEELAERFADLGIGPQDQLTCYCGSGVTAIHNILALMIAGYPEPALYPGSWSEWIRDPQRPVATGD